MSSSHPSRKVSRLQFLANECVVRQGVSDYISALHIIQRAHVENITEDGNVIIVKQLVENDVFGEQLSSSGPSETPVSELSTFVRP